MPDSVIVPEPQPTRCFAPPGRGLESPIGHYLKNGCIVSVVAWYFRTARIRWALTPSSSGRTARDGWSPITPPARIASGSTTLVERGSTTSCRDVARDDAWDNPTNRRWMQHMEARETRVRLRHPIADSGYVDLMTRR